MNTTISVKDVLKYMDSVDESGQAVCFDLVVRTFSRQNKSGGSMKYYNGVRKPSAKKFKRNLSEIDRLFSIQKDRKNPDHFSNRTRNIELADGSIKKVNYLFIVKFNGKNVVY